MFRLFCCYFLANLFLPVAGDETTEEPLQFCNNITQGLLVVKKDRQDCQLDPSDPSLAAIGGHLTLDLSKADETTLCEFFAKGFTKLQGGIKMIGNTELEKLNFVKLKEWDPSQISPGGTFIEIRNNPKLTSIEWDSSVDFVEIPSGSTDGKYAKIYNNPLLEKPIKELRNLGNAKWISTQKGECQFQNFENENIYATTKELDQLLPLCQKIIGDLKLENRKITKNFQLGNNSCLRLINVDMTGVELTAGEGEGNLTCGDKKTSEIRKNPGLCYVELEKLDKYFGQNGSEVAIEPDDTCAEICPDQAAVDRKYGICNITEAAVDLSQWFIGVAAGPGPPKFPEFKWKNLKKAMNTVTISNDTIQKIEFPALLEVKHLKIVNNENLKEINFPALIKIDELTILDNLKLQPSGMKISNLPAKRHVVCNLNNSTVIQDIKKLNICTVIQGHLVLKGLKAGSVDENALKDKIIEGCITLESTELKKIEFLNKATIKCPRIHIFKDNPHLCVPKMLQNQTIEVEGQQKTKGCGKACKSLSEGNCGILEGNLIVLDTTSPAGWKDLEEIRGKLIISNTQITNLSFCKLEIIESDQAPALIIRNNKKLKYVTMPKMLEITAKSGGWPVVEIVDNIELDVDDIEFLPKNLKSSCTKEKKTRCYLAYTERNSDGMPLHGWLIIVALICHLLVVAGVVGWLIYTKSYRPMEVDAVSRPENHSAAEKRHRRPRSKSPSPTTPQLSSALRSDPPTPSLQSHAAAKTKPKSKSPAISTPKTKKRIEPVKAKKKAPK